MRERMSGQMKRQANEQANEEANEEAGKGKKGNENEGTRTNHGQLRHYCIPAQAQLRDSLQVTPNMASTTC